MMKILAWLFGICMLLTLSISVTAAIYRYINPDGTVTYTDQPRVNAKPVKLPPTTISKPNQPENIEKELAPIQKKQTAKKKKTYTEFIIESPTDKETFQNQTSIEVEIEIDPQLQKGDTIQLYLDGKPILKPSGTTVFNIPKVLDNKQILPRGTHTLYAVILDKKNDIIKTTPTITIYIHYGTVKRKTKEVNAI